jgi:hypothetical protein
LPLDSIKPSPLGYAIARTRPNYLQGATLAATAQKLGMSGSELQNQLKMGTRLVDLASSKGVPMEDLRAAIQQGISQNASVGPAPRNRSDSGGRLVDVDA